MKFHDRMIYQEHPESQEKMIFYPDRGYIRQYRILREGSIGLPKIRYSDHYRFQMKIIEYGKNHKDRP